MKPVYIVWTKIWHVSNVFVERAEAEKLANELAAGDPHSEYFVMQAVMSFKNPGVQSEICSDGQ